jgi:hypothetical protein
MLCGEVVNVIESIGVLKIARSTDFGGQFNLLSVAQRQGAIAGLEVDRYADCGFGSEIEGELLAIGGKDWGVGHTAGKQNDFAVVSIQLGSVIVAVIDFDGNSGQGQDAAENR